MFALFNHIQHVVFLLMERLMELFEVVDGKVDAGVTTRVVDGKVLGVVGESARSCNVNLLVNSIETNLSVNFAVNSVDSRERNPSMCEIPRRGDMGSILWICDGQEGSCVLVARDVRLGRCRQDGCCAGTAAIRCR